MAKKTSFFKQDFSKPVADFFEKYMLWLLSMILVVFGGILIYKALADIGFLGDQIEHLHTAYLVSLGQVPYRDFFEHHHPLLWYLLAPIVKGFYPSLKVIFFARFLALGLLAGCLWLLFLITDKFLFDRKSAVLSMLSLLCFPKMWLDIMNLRPDIVMLLTILAGLYSFFIYLCDRRLKSLVISYLWLVISFLVLQKAAMLIVGFSVANLWLLYKKKLPWRDFIIAAGIALMPLICFAAWLTYHHIWNEYWWYNWTLNHFMTEYFAGYTEIHPWIQRLLWLEIIIAAYIYKRMTGQMSITQKIWLCCMLSVFGFTIWFMPHRQYLLPVVFLLAPFVGYFLAHIFPYPSKYIILLLCLILNFNHTCPTYMQEKNFTTYMNEMQFLVENLPPNTEFVSQHHKVFNIYYPNANYYWFGFKEVAMLDVLFNPKQKDFNFLMLVKQKNPQYLVYESIVDTAAARKFHWFAGRNKLILERIKKQPAAKDRFFEVVVPPLPSFWPVDENWLQQHYEKIENTDIWRRKDPTPQ